MRIIDVSVPIRQGMPVYEGDPRVRIRPTAQLDKGLPFNTSLMQLGTHTGTHVDAPYHFIQDGATIDQLPPDLFVGGTLVRYIESADVITRAHLEEADIPAGTERLLLKTANSRLWEKSQFQKQFVHLTEEAAQWICQQGIRLLGVDYISVDAYGIKDFPVHKVLLGSGVAIVEALDLREVTPGKYTLVCLPLKVVGADGAPARAVLIDAEGEGLKDSQAEWLEPVKKQVAYLEEAMGFLDRARQQFEVNPDHAVAVTKLWATAEEADGLICRLLGQMSSHLLEAKGEIDTTRGAAVRPLESGEERLFYDCTWSLLWGRKQGVVVNLAIDASSGAFRAQTWALKARVAEPLPMPIGEEALKEALSTVYVAEATFLPALEEPTEAPEDT